ncbi:nitrate ABC transporter permease [Corynebacterium sp. 13CS0277]|uniref:ABC transporter permease n=1 Tax=Corynebacterium sp. 13CS0277 TaxID=2071994 RepID=UPI000D036D20|nr:ABC transporter permease [Corynebacterium sp. 13CS0277]PRQ12539.1 nitrate ABC transporter permease [Corynebacterium sp. 13CS0277]
MTTPILNPTRPSTPTTAEDSARAAAPRRRAWPTPPGSPPDARATARAAAFSLTGITVFLAAWHLAAQQGWLSPIAPTPNGVWTRAVDLVGDPFYRTGPASVGMFWHLLASLQRVLVGFAIATAVAVPLGLLTGLHPTLRRATEPVVQVLRPVSPLAWLPLGLALLRDAEHTAIFVIVFTAVWPTLLATAEAVRTIPPTYLHLAATLGTSRLSTLVHVIIPATLPGIATGLRLSLSTSWLVIIAAEMLVGGRGMGFFLWNMWNRLDTDAIVVAILIIGATGFALDTVVNRLTKVIRYA